MPKKSIMFLSVLTISFSGLYGEMDENQTLPTTHRIHKISAEVVLAANTNAKKYNEIAQERDRFDSGYPNTNVPYDLGTSDIHGSELNKSNQPYDPNAGYFNTNQGYDEYNPAYNEAEMEEMQER